MAIDFFCGWECRIERSGAAPVPDERHWDGPASSTVLSISTAIFRTGTAALRANATGTGDSLVKDINRNVFAGRIYVRFATLPGSGTLLLVSHNNANGNLNIQYDQGTGNIRIACAAAGGTSATIGAVTTGIWYRIDWLANTSAATASLKARLDGGAEGEATAVQVSANMTTVRYGIGNSATGDVYFDDLASGDATGDYPIGAGTVERMKPTRDGAHSFTAGDFRYNAGGANIATSATDVWSYVDDDALTDITDFIAQRVIRTTGYVEVGFGTAPFTHDPLGVMVVSSWHASTTGANTVGMKMNDGGTLRDMLDESGDDLSDFSNTTFTQAEKLLLTPPSGGTWTKAKLEALLMRAGYSGDVIGEPFWDGLMLEVAYGPAPPATDQMPYVGGGYYPS